MSEDEQIQHQIENGKTPEGAEADAYRLVFHALKKEPATALPDNFAKRVSSLALAPKKSFDWDKFFFVAGLLAFICALGYAVFATSFTFSVGTFQFLANHSYFVIFAIAVLALVQWVDKKILKAATT